MCKVEKAGYSLDRRARKQSKGKSHSSAHRAHASSASASSARTPLLPFVSSAATAALGGPPILRMEIRIIGRQSARLGCGQQVLISGEQHWGCKVVVQQDVLQGECAGKMSRIVPAQLVLSRQP